MTDFLRKSLAPIADEAWTEIETQARQILTGHLSARRMVNVEGPRGWDFSAVNLGRVSAADSEPVDGVRWGVRAVQPLVEARAPFELSIWELDNRTRGARDVDLGPLIRAARQIARFEEQAVYNGFQEGGIRGIVAASPHTPIHGKADASALVEALEHALVAVEKAGIGGPFGLVADAAVYARLMAGAQQGYPIRPRVEALFTAGIHWSPAVEGAVVLSTREGHYELTLGQDLAVGYQYHDARTVQLYLTESFTFRVLEPAAAIAVQLNP